MEPHVNITVTRAVETPNRVQTVRARTDLVTRPSRAYRMTPSRARVP